MHLYNKRMNFCLLYSREKLFNKQKNGYHFSQTLDKNAMGYQIVVNWIKDLPSVVGGIIFSEFVPRSLNC